MYEETERLLKEARVMIRETRKELRRIRIELQMINKAIDDYDAFLYPEGKPENLPGETVEEEK